MKIKRCKHGKVICCECRYGKIQPGSSELGGFDLTQEISDDKFGYRLMKGADYNSIGTQSDKLRKSHKEQRAAKWIKLRKKYVSETRDNKK